MTVRPRHCDHHRQSRWFFKLSGADQRCLYRQTPFIPLLLFCLLLFSGCREKEEGNCRDYYPLQGFIRTELKALESLPIAVSRYTTRDLAKTDTSVIGIPDFSRLVDSLIRPDISLEPLCRSYKETVFMDETLNRVTLTYTPLKASPEIRKLDILIEPETEKVKSFYLEKQAEGEDGTLMKMNWTAGKSFQISYIAAAGNKAPAERLERFVWGFQEP